MSHWLEDAVTQGLAMMDVEEALEAQRLHFSEKGEWEKGVISPSLVAVSCPLQRVKIFLGQTPVPGQEPHMAIRAAKPDAVSLINMVRGFDGEGLIIAALRKSYPEHIIDSAPKFDVKWFDDQTGYRYAGHPDVFMRLPAYRSAEPELGLIQIKCPSVFKMDRVEKKGDSDALETYLPQMATELFIARKAGLDVVESNLLLFSWEGTPKLNRPRVKAVTLPWDESLATVPERAAVEIHEAAAKALMFNQWPKAFPATSWDVWPCSYCRFARLGDFDVPACDDHEKWRTNGDHENDPGGRREAAHSTT
jgi:hypothetical protein